MRGTTFRRVRSLAIAILLGAIIPTAVAIACARLSLTGALGKYQLVRNLDPSLGKPRGKLSLQCFAKPGLEMWHANAPARATQVVGFLEEPPESRVSGRLRALTLPWTTGALPWPQETAIFPDHISVYASGWPLPTLYAQRLNIAGRPRWEHVIDTEGNTPNPAAPFTSIPGIPTGILWDRFAINTSAYGALWWPLLFAPGTIRYFHRKRNGLCLKCAYDLRATPPTLSALNAVRPNMSHLVGDVNSSLSLHPKIRENARDWRCG